MASTLLNIAPRVLLTVAALVMLVTASVTQPERQGLYMDQSTFLLQVVSLAHDGDLVYGPEDRERFLKLGWGPEPLGLYLRQSGDTYYFAKPAGYALLVAPFAWFAPNRGALLLNALLWVLLTELSFRWLRRRMHPMAAAGLAVICWGATAVPFYVFVIHPDILIMALLSVVLYVGLARSAGEWGRRELLWRPAVLGLVSGLLIYEKLPLVFFAASMIVMWWSRGWWRGAAIAAVCCASSFFALSGIHLLEDGKLTAYQGNRFIVSEADPFSPKADKAAGVLPVDTKKFFDVRAVGGRLAPDRLVALAKAGPKLLLYFTAGRKGGLFPYLTPFLLVLLLSVAQLRRRTGWPALWVLIPLAAYCLFYFILTPLTFHGGPTMIGNRYAAQVAPAMLFALTAPGVSAGLVSAAIGFSLFAALLFPGRALLSPATAMRDNFLLFQWNRLASLPLEEEMIAALCDRYDCRFEAGARTRIYRLSEPGPAGGLTYLWMGQGGDSRFLVVRENEPGAPISVRLATAHDEVQGYLESGDRRTSFHLRAGETSSVEPEMRSPSVGRLGRKVQYSWPLRVVVTDIRRVTSGTTEAPGSGLFVQLAQPAPGYPERVADGSFVIDPCDRRAASLLLWGWWGMPEKARGDRWAGGIAESALAVPGGPEGGRIRLASVRGTSFGGPNTVTALAEDGTSATVRMLPAATEAEVGLDLPEMEGGGETVLSLRHSDLRKPGGDGRALSVMYDGLRFVDVD